MPARRRSARRSAPFLTAQPHGAVRRSCGSDAPSNGRGAFHRAGSDGDQPRHLMAIAALCLSVYQTLAPHFDSLQLRSVHPKAFHSGLPAHNSAHTALLPHETRDTRYPSVPIGHSRNIDSFRQPKISSLENRHKSHDNHNFRQQQSRIRLANLTHAVATWRNGT